LKTATLVQQSALGQRAPRAQLEALLRTEPQPRSLWMRIEDQRQTEKNLKEKWEKVQGRALS